MAPRGAGPGRSILALLALLSLAVISYSLWYTSSSLQYTEEAHVEFRTVRERADARELFRAAAAAAAAGEDSFGDTSAPDLPAVPKASAGAAQDTQAQGGACVRGRPRPYHILITSSSGVYQAWQTRVTYHHVMELKRHAGPCSDMGGVTRLLTMPAGRPDSLMDVIPTHVVKELRPGAEDHGFVVMNRPHSVKAFVEDTAAWERFVKEEYVLIAETDHIWLRPVPNDAEPDRPFAFHFGYMEPQFRAGLIDRFCPGKGASKTMDPVGPSPIIIHVDQLRKVVGPWLDMSHKLKTDPDADAQLGWVLEMWGYSIATTCMGIRHKVSAEFQFEGGSIGSHERAFALFPIFHYTYGIEYSVAGVPMELSVGHWSLDKRHYGGTYPPRSLSDPPRCGEARARVLQSSFNNASAAIADWPGAGAGAAGAGTPTHVGQDTWRVRPEHAPVTPSTLARSALARLVLGTGPWRWSGPGCCGQGPADDAGSAVNVFFMRDGFIWTEMGSGTWQVDDAVTAETPPGRAERLRATFIGVTSVLTFETPEGGEAPWTFVAEPVRATASANGAGTVLRGRGDLRAPAEVRRRWARPVPPLGPGLAPPQGEAVSLSHVARLEGSGFYRTWGCLLRAGVAWRGPHGGDEWELWQVAEVGLPDAPRPQGSTMAGEATAAEWGSGVVVHIVPLARGSSVPLAPGPNPGPDAAAGGAAGERSTAGRLVFSRCWAFAETTNPRRTHEWIIPANARRVIPGCAEPNLPRAGKVLNLPAEALAQSLIESGEWSWAGNRGFFFREPPDEADTTAIGEHGLALVRTLTGGALARSPARPRRPRPRLGQEGLLETPWGTGHWGLVPRQNRLAWAGFAQQMHILDFGTGGGSAVTGAAGDSSPGLRRFQSSRCSDGELVEGLLVSPAKATLR